MEGREGGEKTGKEAAAVAANGFPTFQFAFAAAAAAAAAAIIIIRVNHYA